MKLSSCAKIRIERFRKSFRGSPRTLLNSVPSNNWKSNHIPTIRLRRNYALPSQAASNSDFCFHLDRTLSQWGAKRLGAIGSTEFVSQIKKAAGKLDSLSSLRIESIDYNIDESASDLWEVIAELRITAGDARLVSGTKAIHHLLPDLLPPMDNEYTGSFFFYPGAIYRKSSKGERLEGKYFKAMFPAFVDLARDLAPELNSFVSANSFNTSIPKTLDNAIIGFMELERHRTDNELFDSLE